MHLRSFQLALALLLAVARVEADEERPTVKHFTCGPVYRKPGFATLDAFLGDIRSRKEPWNELLMPDDIPDYDEVERFKAPLTENVSVIHRSRDSAIVFAENKPFRTSPYAAVIFLLSRSSGKYHVADFIRRATGYESYSDVVPPKILKLEPRGFTHFSFTEYDGGRRWSFDHHELYLVRHQRFHRTLRLRNGGAYLSPVDPYREFDQTLDLTVARGQPRFTVERIWGMADGQDRKQSFNVVFRWDQRSSTFVSPKAWRITLAEPDVWEGDTLPKPPASNSRSTHRVGLRPSPNK